MGRATAASEAEGFGTSNEASVPGGGVDSLQGRTGPNTPSGSSAPYGVGGLYGEGRYDYSIQMYTSDGVGSGSLTAGANYTLALADYKDVNFNQEFSSSIGALDKLTFTKSDLTNADIKAIRSFNITQSANDGTALTAGYMKLLPQFSKDNGDGTISFIVSARAAVTG